MKRPVLREIITDLDSIKPAEITQKLSRLFLFKPIKPFKGLSDFEDFGELYSILCINCHGLIHIDNIESHSKTCTTYSGFVSRIEEEPTLTQSIFKLQRLSNTLKDFLTKKSIKLSEKSVIANLIRIIQPLFGTIEDEQLLKSFEEVEKINKYFKGSIAVSIYIDRVKLLIENAIKSETIMQSTPGFQLSVRSESREFDCDESFGVSENKMQTYTNPNKRAAELKRDYVNSSTKRKISNIYSDMGCSSVSSLISTLGIEEKSMNTFDKVEIVPMEDLKKYFYSLCMSLKIKYSARREVNRISNHKLYKEVEETRIPCSEWLEFLEKVFSNPEKKYMENPPRRSSSIKSKLSFEEIIEI